MTYTVEHTTNASGWRYIYACTDDLKTANKIFRRKIKELGMKFNHIGGHGDYDIEYYRVVDKHEGICEQLRLEKHF